MVTRAPVGDLVLKAAGRGALATDEPSYALPYFGPSAQGRLGAIGVMSYLSPSVIDERGFNANLVGAAVLAEKTFAQSAGAQRVTQTVKAG